MLVVDLDSTPAMFCHTLRLPKVDSLNLATARAHQARIFTMNAGFRRLSDVELIEKRS